MRRRSQNLDDIVINSVKIFQSESCEIWRYLHQIFLPAYHLPEQPWLLTTILYLCLCWWDVMYSVTMTKRVWRREKNRQVRVTGKEALFYWLAVRKANLPHSLCFSETVSNPDVEAVYFVEEMLLPSYPTSTTIFSSGFICTPAPRANPVFLEEILLEKESPSWVECSLNVAFTVPTPASAYNEKLSDNR